MAIDYILDAIKATAGEPIEVCAEIADTTGEPITEGCQFMLHGESDSVIAMIDGSYGEGIWSFVIPAEVTEGLKGRYYYCIKSNDESLCFRKPFYLV